MARIESRSPYDASFPQAGSGEFSRIAQEAAKKRSEEKAQEQAQAQERAYAVTEPTPKEEVVEATPIEEPTLKEPIAKPKVKPMPFPRVSFQEDAPRAEKEQKPKAKPMPFPRYDFQEDAPWAVNGISPKAPTIPAAPQKKAEKPSAASKGEATDIGADLDPHIVAGHQVSFQEDAPWAKDNPYAFGLEQGFRNQNKFAGKPISELEKDAVFISNRMGITGKDYLMEKEIKRRKNKLRDFEFIANTPGALASYGITLTEDKWERIKGEILSGTDSLKDLTPLLHKAKALQYEEGKGKQRTISQVSDRAKQLANEMERTGATKEADQAIADDAKFASLLPTAGTAARWSHVSYNDKLPDTYRATLQLQEHANELSQMNKSFLSNLEKNKNWAGGVWEGFKNNILSGKAWQNTGSTYAANEMALYRIIQAYNKGDDTPNVKAIVEMAAELNSAEAFMRSQLPKGYEAGESTAGSIPFMIDFIVTSALTGGAGGVEKATAKIGANGVKALATRGILTASGKGTRFLELLARYGQKAAQGVKGVATAVAEKAPGVTRMGGRIAKDATQAAIMTATLNAPSVVSDAERRVTPIPYKLEGDLSDISDFIPINDDHILMERRFMERNRNKALRKAFTSQWIENYSELAGGHFDTYLKALGKLTNFSGTAAGKAIARLNNALSKAPVVGSVRRAANIQGLGGEFTEEIYGGMLNAWLVGDQSMKDVFDAKNMGTTLEALLPTQIAFGILGGGGHALSLAKNKRQLAQIDKQLKEEFGDTDDGGKRWEKLTLSEQGKVLDGLTGVYRDAMGRSNEAKDDATRQKAVKEATYARLLFMRLGLQTRRSVLQGAEAEAKLTQTQEKFDTLMQEAENALKAEAKRTTTDRAGNSVTVRYNNKEYSVYNTEDVTISQDEKGEPRVLGKGTLYLRAPETDGGSAEIIPVPSDQVEVIAVHPKEEVDAAIEQSAETVAEAAIQPELAAQEAESAPTAQEAESAPTAQVAKSAPITQKAERTLKTEAHHTTSDREWDGVMVRYNNKEYNVYNAEGVIMGQNVNGKPRLFGNGTLYLIAPESDGGNTEIIPVPSDQVEVIRTQPKDAESTPMAQEAESAPNRQESERTPTTQEAESAPMAQEAESTSTVQEAKNAPMTQEAERTPMAQEAESTPTMQEAEQSVPKVQSSEERQVAPKEEASQTGTDHLSTAERTKAIDNAPVSMQPREGNRITLTDASGNSLTVRLSDEKDRNGKPYVLTSDGKLSYGVVPGGLVPEEPKTKEVRLSLGNQNDSSINYRYGLIHIMEKHFAQLKELGFDTVEAYIKHVLKNIGGAVLDKIYAGKTTHFVFTTPFPSENHPKQKRVDTVIVELHEESDHWDIINTWRSTEAYIKKKKEKEKRGTVPSIGLSHAADKTEVFDESTTRSSGSQREGNSPQFSSTDKDTKKSEPSDVPLEKGTNDAEAAPTDEAFRIGNEPNGKRISERTWHQLVDRLGKSGLATEFVTDSKAFSEKLNSFNIRDRELIGGKTVFGFVDKRTGCVYLNPETMDADTPLHECAHLWNTLIHNTNPELWARGRYLIEQSPYAFEVRNEEAYRGLSAEERADEALARAIADRGEKILKQSGMRGLALRAWIRDVWQHILAFFGIKKKAKTLNDLTDMALGDLLNGQAKSYEIPKEEEASQILFRIGNKRREEYRERLRKKRTDLSDVAIEKTLDAIEAFGEEEAGDKGDSKLETLALHWTLNGSIDLTREADAKNLDDIPDSTLVRQAAEAARRKKVDPMQYDAPKTLLSNIAEGMTFDKRLDPDKEPCFTARHEVPGTDIVVYDVANNKEGQRAVRAFVDSHWGVNANPWCLITRNTDAWHYWNHYDYLQKRIAFQNGKLLAFKACDKRGGDTPWWNRQDENSPGVPSRKDLGGGKYLPLNVDEETGNPIGKAPKYALRGERGGKLYEEWTPDGKQILLREMHGEHHNRTFERWTEDGVLVARSEQKNAHRKEEQWYPSGQREYLSIATGRGSVSSSWHENGNRKSFCLSRPGNDYYAEWYENGQRQLIKTDNNDGQHIERWYENGQQKEITNRNADGIYRCEKWHENGQHKLLETIDNEFNKRKEEWYANGQRESLETIDKEANKRREAWYENGQRKLLETLDNEGNEYAEIWFWTGQRQLLETIDKDGSRRTEEWHDNGQRFSLETEDKEGNRRREEWFKNGQRESLETTDKEKCKYREEWDENDTRKGLLISKRNDNVIYKIGLDEKGEVVSADYINYPTEIDFQRENGELTETFRMGAMSSEDALREMSQAFLEETGEELRFPGAKPLAADVQYRKGKQVTLTDVKGNSLTVQLSDEKDRNGNPYVLTSDGKLSYGVIPGGLVPEEPKTKEVRLSLGSDVKMKGKHRYGLEHIMKEHFAQLKALGFNTVEAYIKHVLTHIHKAVLEKKRESGVSYFVVTEPFPSQKHPDKNSMDSLIVTLYNKSDHWEIINTWHTSADYIKRKEQEPSVPTVGLPYATDKAEVRPGEPTKGSDSTYAAGTLNLSLSTDKDTKKINDTNEAWEAKDNPQSAADEVTQHEAYRDALTAQYGEATRDAEADKARKQQVAEDALRKMGLEGVQVEVVSRSDVAEAYARDAMGWHDRKTGKVTIVAENNELEDIEATVLHEVVGHHGLEALLGKEGLATLTNEVLPLIPEAERKRLEETYGTDEQTIAEEYIAGMAEQYTPPSLWARIAGFIRNALRRIGFRLPLTNGDLLYLTWRGIRATRKEQSSTDTLLHRADEKRVIARCQELDDIQFRKPRKQILSELAADGVDEKGVLKLTEAMNELLEKRVYKLRETWQNDTQSFIELARCVEAATGETIPDEMNIDKVYNQSASKAFARQEETRKKYDRMMQAVRYFARKAQLSPELTELYFLAKHAPERNAEMRRRAEELFDPTTRTEEQEEILNNYYTNLFPGWNKQNGDAYASEAEAREAFFGELKDALTTKDYAAEEAITERIATLIKQDKKSPYKAITDEGNLLNAFTEAVEARAGHQDVYHVWQLINGFNRGTIELWRSSGMIDEATYQKVTGMFAHYVPMQGWKENTNQTPWEYNIRAHIDTNPLKTMHGRQSLPGSPFEAMLKSAMNSIVAATRNEERQALYFFAQRYGSDYLSASSAWYVLQQEGDTKRWVEAYPETVTRKTEKGDAIESTTQETAEAFFARMKELEARGLARQRTQSTRPETGYLLSERQEQEHVVPLFFDGQKYNVFVNGNPRFSRAATRHNRATDSNGAADKLLRSVRWFTREMGQNITGRSLSFGAANMVRDLLFAEMSSSTIYGTRYALAFNRAYFTDVIPLMLGLKKGDTARLYNEYKANGGRTGFAFLTGDKRSARSTRSALSNSLSARAGRAGRSFWNAYMGINEHLEDMSRFAAYAAARKMGLGITEATHRAKSITVNFNKRGTGNSPMYQFLSTLYLFFNANLQGVALTGKMFRDHPKRAAAWSIGLILLQPLLTLLYTALATPDGDDGDDEAETLQEKYDRLPLKDVNPFLRRSNICIPLGEGKLIKVPLSPEMRALNGIGVTLSDMLMGRATSGDVALATIDGALNSSSIGLDASISSFTDANELAERGENGALYTALRGAVPSALQPFGDIAANRDWSGRRIYGESVYHRGTPSYLYADKSTPRWMTNAAAGWNTMLYGQGDKHIGEVSTGLLSVNPSSVNYLAERYLGGILEFVTDLNRSTDMLTDPNGGSVSQALGQAPVTRRFWKDDPLMQGSEARRNFYSTRRALRQDIERIDRMKRNAKNADYKEANEIRNSIRTYLDGRNEMQLRYLAKRFDALSDTIQAHDEAYAGKDTETRLSVRERDTRAIERLLKDAERLEAVSNK